MPASIPFRVILSQNGVSRKFFTLFQGKDGSLYIHPNRKSGKPWKTPKLESRDATLMLDFEAAEEKSFDLHKISFHPSGFIHMTNKRGERLRDGTRGPSFEEMDDLYLLCIIAPSRLEEMPIFSGDPKSMVVDFVVPDEVPPFFMTLALLKGEAPEGEPDDTQITPRFVLPLQSGYKLTFLLRKVRHRDKETPATWPPFPFFLLRTAS